MARRATLPTVEAHALPPHRSRVVVPLAPGSVTPWAPGRLAIDPWTILRLSRYKRRDAVAPAIWETARRMAARAEALAVPRALLAGVRADAAERRFSGRAVASLLAGCPLVVAFVLTLGPRLEDEVAALAERRELLESFLLDTAGWGAIEAAVRALRLDLRARLGPAGWRVTHRLAPGYADWPIEEQAALLDLFADASPPARLSAHGVLVPFKSITGLFGLTPPPP
jgi:hypothetical protein